MSLALIRCHQFAGSIYKKDIIHYCGASSVQFHLSQALIANRSQVTFSAPERIQLSAQ